EEVAVALRVRDVERRYDVRMTDARCEPRLVEEHRDELVVVREVRVQHLDRDQALEARDALRARDVDRRHAARCELHEHFVTAELLPAEIAGRLRSGLGLRHGDQNLPAIDTPPPSGVAIAVTATSTSCDGSPSQSVRMPRTKLVTASALVTPIRMLV